MNIEFANSLYLCIGLFAIRTNKITLMVKKNAIMRYKILDSLLSNRNRFYSITDLLNKVNEALVADKMSPVSRRCIEKDLNFLECAPYSAEIERFWCNGKKCIRYKEVGFSIFTKKLTDYEQDLLSEVLNTIDQFDGLDNFEWVSSLKRQLKIQKHRRIIQFHTNPYLLGKNLMRSLFTAISNKQVIALKYHTFTSSEVKEKVVYPYLLKEYNTRWFLIAGIQDGSIYTFPLDRIDGFEPMPQIDYVDCNDDIESRFEDIVGVTLYKDRPVENILIWVDAESYPHIKTKPLHGSQSEISTKKDSILREKYPSLVGGRFLKLRCILNYELEKLLMSYMDKIVVLEPVTLTESIKTRVKNLSNLYNI